MNEFMFLFRNVPPSGQPSPEAMQASMQKWMGWFDTLGKSGHLANIGNQLQGQGAVVKGTGKLVTDGPYTESKEVIGGFSVIRAIDLPQAVELAKGCPIYEENGSVEVRPILKM